MSAEAETAVRTAQAATAAPFTDSRQQLLAALAYADLRVRWAVARARAHGLDPADEFRGLYITEGQVDALLENGLGYHIWSKPNGHQPELEDWPETVAHARRQLAARNQVSKDLLLGDLIENFGLAAAEVDVLLLTLAPEIDPRYERLFSYLQDDVTKKRPSVDLMLNLLSDRFEEKLALRRYFTDEATLFRSRLLERGGENGREATLLSQTLRPAARVVEHLLGISGLDSQLSGVAELMLPDDTAECPQLPQSLLRRLEEAVAAAPGERPMLAFRGPYGVGKRRAAEHVACRLKRPLITVDLAALATQDADLGEALRLALRDGRLLHAVVYIVGWDTVVKDGRPPSALFREMMAYPQTVIVAGEEIWQPAGPLRQRRILRVVFERGDYDYRVRMWRHYLPKETDIPLNQLANQFRFSAGQIEDVVATAHDLAEWRRERLAAEDLFVASRAHSNQKLGELATKIVPRYLWDDIVLPKDSLAQLREMVNTVRQRPTVYGQWGFGRKQSLGKGLSALFAGESGTGKTMAADIIANELKQDLYKIDLSMLVSKYIGETEKNLNKVFSEAATSNAILFFDEADAIFGKRSEVKDSHDRYANLEISYLLQRMEAYDGVVILATNLRSNLDDAFTRRLHFIVEFPFPEAPDRERIWRVNVPAKTPLADDVDFDLLARRYRLAGGNIRNIIMAAAFLAARDGEAVGMPHLFHATRREYQKIGRLVEEGQFELDGAG